MEPVDRHSNCSYPAVVTLPFNNNLWYLKSVVSDIPKLIVLYLQLIIVCFIALANGIKSHYMCHFTPVVYFTYNLSDNYNHAKEKGHI